MPSEQTPAAKWWRCEGDHPDIDGLPIAVGKGDTCPSCGASAPDAAPARRRRVRDDAALGYTQKLVLRLLADGAKSASHLAYDWPNLTYASAYSAVSRLARRGLVDVAGWDDYSRRTYCLTERGAAVERSLNIDLEDEDGDA